MGEGLTRKSRSDETIVCVRDGNFMANFPNACKNQKQKNETFLLIKSKIQCTIICYAYLIRHPWSSLLGNLPVLSVHSFANT